MIPSGQNKVFRGLLVNACVHRDYAIHGSRTRVFMFDDRSRWFTAQQYKQANGWSSPKWGKNSG